MYKSLDLSKIGIKPKLSIHRPNKSKIGNINEAYEKGLTLKLNGLDELNFKIPYQVIGSDKQLKRNKNVDKIKHQYLVYLQYHNYTQWFIAEPPVENSNEDSEYLSITCYSLENELRKDIIRMYQKTSITITTVTNDVLIDTNWSLGRVPSGFEETSSTKPYRSFDIPSKRVLECVREIGETFGVVPLFDTNNKIINYYKEDEIGENKGLRISDRKYLQSIIREQKVDEFCTRLKVYGQDDISIQRVNPTGQNYIEDFSYFLYPFQRDSNGNVIESSDYMSDSLANAILDYNDLVDSKTGEFEGYLNDKETLQTTLTTKENEMATLQDEYAVIKDDLETAKQDGSDTTQLETDLSNKQDEINTKQTEIDQVESDIAAVDSNISSLRNTLKLENNFTTAQLEERRIYTHTQEWSNSNISGDQDLYNEGLKELDKRKNPNPNIDVNVINFLSMVTESKNWNKLVLGDIVNISSKGIDINIKSNISEAYINLEGNDIDLRISNITNIDNQQNRFLNMFYRSELVSNAFDTKKVEWDNIDSNVREYVDKQINDVKSSIDGLGIDIKRVSADGFLSKSESQLLKTSLNQVKSESTDLVNVATNLGIATEKTNYSNALSDLEAYLNNNWIGQPSYPISLLLTDRDTINTKFQAVQDSKSILIDKISSIQATNAENNAKNHADIGISNMSDPFFEKNKHFFTNKSYYEEESPPDLGGTGTIISGVGLNGGNVLEVANEKWIFYRYAIPVDVNKTYRVRFRVRQTVNPTSGGQGIYAGVATLDANYNNITGGDGTHRYCATDGYTLTTSEGWVVFEGEVSGVGDTHNNFRSGTAYVRPMFITNYSSGNGTAQVDVIEFKDVTEEKNAISYTDSYSEKKIVKSSSTPSDTSVLWLDTSLTPNVFKRHNGTVWLKATPTNADEIDESASKKWAGESGADVTGNNTSNDTNNVDGVTSSKANNNPATVIVSDTDTSLNYKQADYIVSSGSYAVTTIQSAINSIGTSGGKVVLLDGTFDVNDTIYIPSNITIEGQGDSTIIRVVAFDDSSGIKSVFRNKSTSGEQDIKIRGMKIDAYNNVTTKPYGIKLNDSNDIIISDVNMMHLNRSVWGSNSNNIMITNSFFWSSVNSNIYLQNTNNSSVTNNYCDGTNSSSSSIGIKINSGNNNVVMGNRCTKFTDGISVSGDNNIISNNICTYSGSDGIKSEGVNSTVSNNKCLLNNNGMTIRYSTNNNIYGNTLMNNENEGVYLIFSSSDNNITNNSFIGNGTDADNIFGHIYIYDSCNRNNIRGNIFRIGSNTYRPKCAVEIATTNCSDNVVVHNDMRNAGVNTSPILNSGTGTITTLSGNLT